MLERDTTSLSNPHQAIVTHLDWNVEVNFEKQVIFGTAVYDVRLRLTLFILGNDRNDVGADPQIR